MIKEIKLIKQIKKRASPKAANELISNYYTEIYTYVYKQVNNKNTAMDITQEIFISVLQSIHNYDEKKASFRTWLYKIATYRIVDYYRSKYYKYQNITVSIDNMEIYDVQDIAATIENKQDVESIMKIVNQFDTLYQHIFRLKIFGEYTFAEISNILKIHESTVKTKYYSMIKKIKKGVK